MSGYRIGEASEQAGMSADTLRYYERIGLLHPILRDGGGRRFYTGADLERLRFIARAQAMDFTLTEIGQLLELRDHPATAREEARRLTHGKLEAVSARMRTLRHLRDELRLLLNLCAGATGQCPILELKTEGAPPVSRRAKQPLARRRRKFA